MNHETPAPTRREFLKNTGRVAAATTLAGIAIPHVHAAENNTIQLALIGCGGRGTGAVADAFSGNNGPLKLVAMADVFDYRLNGSYDALKKQFGDRVDVSNDHKFVGFDGYKKAMDCLKPGDIAILTTPPAFRWLHFGNAIEKNLNVFMEKPVTVDGPTTRKMLALAEESTKKNLKVGVGLMCRHCKARNELRDRIQSGQIGDITGFRAYRTGGSGGCGPKPADMSELLFQIQRFHSFLWASGGLFSDFNIHQIDECCMMKGAWPIKAQANGGRHFRGNNIDQNFDNYSVEYIFADGVRMFFFGRHISNCHDEFASYVHGTKGSGVVSTWIHTPAKCRIYKGQNVAKKDLVWAFPQPEPSPYQLEWVDLIDAIRQNKPYNEVKRGAEASLVTSMGRMAAHTGQIITYDQMLNCEHEFAPGLGQLTMNSPAPLLAGPDGKYPFPQPGITTKREF
jgi:predicted dehydrogenase